MAILGHLNPLRLVPDEEPNPFTAPSTINIDQDVNAGKIENGALVTENPDGSSTIDFAHRSQRDDDNDFYGNLVEKISEAERSRIASELIDGISNDDQSRREWLDTRAQGIKLLGLKLNIPSGEATSEGVSQVQHPLLLDSVLRFQANARGELLPSGGPVKVRNDAPLPPSQPPAPPPPQMGHNGGPPMMSPAGSPPPGVGSPPTAGLAPPSQPANPATPPPPPTGVMQPPSPAIPDGKTSEQDELANALEKDMNHFLTAVATEYVPDTDKMLFWVGAGGQGIKKVYNCPLRRRPVSESVDAEDLLVNNATTNLENCGRITHVIKMRPSTLKRMQLIGAYLDVDVGSPETYMQPTQVDTEKAAIQGVKAQPQRQEDAEHVIYECYCELDIEGFEHEEKGKPTGLQLPYVVTIHKQSQKILQVRRNWEEDDKLCMAKQYFVDFPFVRALGFYAIGLINIVGNTTAALTAAWREALDAGMFANFPGFIYQKQYGRQLTNQMRVAPGSGIGLDTGGQPIQQAVMPLPYKDVSGAFIQLMTMMQDFGSKAAGAADIGVGEGKQDAPVGTTLALIEQATKVLDAVHKRLHDSQAKEFQLLKDRFREDPESFWRYNNKPTLPWRKEQFLKALNDFNLVPVADPNNPTSMHRIAKGAVVKALQQQSPALYDPIAVDTYVLRIAGIDAQGLFRPTPAQPPPDPSLIAAQAKAQAMQQQNQATMMQMQLKSQIQQMQSQDKAADRESRERIEQMKIVLERLKIIEERIIHGDSDDGSANDQMQAAAQLIADQYKHVQTLHHEKHMSRVQEDNKVQMNRENNETKVKIASMKPAPKPAGKK